MTAAELIVSAMQAEGVSAAFGLVGTHVVEIYEALRRAPDIRHVTSKHEGNATLMADAYSRLSGKISVCFSTAGPGLLNSLAGVGQAYASNSPTIHISGSLPLGAPRRSLHALDREDYTVKTLAHLTKLSVRPGTLDELAAVLPRCFAAAKDAEPGPVHIEIPWDLMMARRGRVPAYRPRVQKIAKAGAMPASLVRKLRAARQPLFCVDALCIRNGMLDDVITLAESHGAMMVVSYDAFGAVRSAHPLNAGVLSDFYFGTAALDAIGQADFIIGFGVLAKSESERLIRQHAKVRPILADGRELRSWRQRGSLAAIEPVMGSEGKKPWFARRCHGEWRKAVVKLAKPRPRGAMHFGRAMLNLAGRIDADTTIILDAGSHEIWARAVLPSFGVHSFIGSGNWGGMGYGLPGLIGARIAHPEKRAVAITGDGCLLMSMADLCTLASVGGPAVMVVMNNAMYGEIKRVQLARFAAGHEIDIPALDFARIAESFGIRGIRVEREGALDAAFAEALASPKPVIVDVVCGDDVAFPEFP
jgi:acetolactate synthase I/II/III large subunit